MLLLSKTLSRSLSFMFEAVIVVGVRRQLPSPKSANRVLAGVLCLVLKNSFKVLWAVWKGE